ncbi:MAG TPA: translation initiation factor IF-2 [Candidatus Omnitrophica bacterium]|nr:translation initiation factor IF-2 [Candidatus Omnitrophota bacterium]
MSIRVHHLAKELGFTSKEFIEKLRNIKIDVKGHMSSLDEETAVLVREEFGGAKPAKEKKVTEKQKTDVIPHDEPAPEEKKEDAKLLKINLPITVKDLAVKLQTKPSELIKRFLTKKILVTINQSLDEKSANSIAEDFGYRIEQLPTQEEEVLAEHKEEDPSKLKPRAPIVTFMGHVDHGKTSLLDMIRKTKIVDKESGGITQHIGAYEVSLPKGKVTFLDTPGHAAFTAMRARGANVTDIVVLVVAADDGIMPQTIEAIDHARAAGVPIVVAMNKIDKKNINTDKIKKQLAEFGLTPEDWGGKTITVGVSAKTGEGIDNLLEMLLLESEMLELKADPNQPASGVVVEAELSKGKGPVATILVSKGTLRTGDIVIVGLNYGKIKAMFDDKGRRIKEAGPSTPVEILGLSGVPLAGEKFYAVSDDKKAREIISARQMKADKKKLENQAQKISLEDLYNRIKEGQVKELKIILKADVQGSLEAIKDSLEKLSTQDVKLSVIHYQVGNINESDVMLASASDAVILGFHVDVTPGATPLSKQEGVDVRLYSIIYEVVNDVKAAMEGMLEPIMEEQFLGRAEVRQVFKVSKVGMVAGCYILKGAIPRNATCKLIRESEVIFKGKITSLKHVKDDIKEAKEGFECGISLSYKDIKKGDLIEAVEIRKIARRLK